MSYKWNCISLVISDVIILWCGYLPFLYLLWWSIVHIVIGYWVLRVCYVFWIKVFIRYAFCKYFFPVSDLFVFSFSSQCEEQKLILLKSQFIDLNIFSHFMDHTFGVVCNKSLLNPKSKRFSLVFSSGGVIVLDFIFRSVIHFELVSYVVWGMDRNYLINMKFCFIGQTFLLPLNFLCTFVENQLIIYVWVCFWIFLPILLIRIFTLSPIPHWLNYRTL